MFFYNQEKIIFFAEIKKYVCLLRPMLLLAKDRNERVLILKIVKSSATSKNNYTSLELFLVKSLFNMNQLF